MDLQIKNLKEFMILIQFYEFGIYKIIRDIVLYKFNNKEELRIAVNEWCNPETHEYAKNKYGLIGLWNVSKIEDMSELFTEQVIWNNITEGENRGKYYIEYINYIDKFDDNINDWDVSNVKTMEDMFSGCKKYNKPLDKWEVGNVTNFSGMFQDCNNFNQSLNNWKLNKAIDISYMFAGCENFNQNLNNWKINKDICDYAVFGDTNKLDYKNVKSLVKQLNTEYEYIFERID